MAFDVEEVAVRSGTSTDWASGLILDTGELGLNLTTGELKFGDGTSAYSALRSIRGKTGTAVLVAGTKLVNEPSVKATSVILLTAQSLGTVTTAKALAVTARVAGTSFTITSADNTDTSTIGYEILEP